MRRKIILTSILAFALLIGGWASASADDKRPIVRQTTPAYPELAKRMNVSGSVVLKTVVAADGHVKSVSVISGHPLLAGAAENAVKEWIFAAGAEETITVSVNFNR